ncbi:hypothetical protein [Aeromonas sp. 602293]|uniref:hypothetical protein n=1 Tax=Aeromonas sp. 602293 TaxID=2712041 RepID=UPI003B9E65BD
MKKIILVALAMAIPVIEANGAVAISRPVIVSRPAVVSAPISKPVVATKPSSSKAYQVNKVNKAAPAPAPLPPIFSSFKDDCEKKTLRCE